jgi:hypothetical protein
MPRGHGWDSGLYKGLLEDAAKDGTRNTTLETARKLEKKGLVTISNIVKHVGNRVKRCDISITEEGRKLLESMDGD